MINGRIPKQPTSNLARTETVISGLRRIDDGWGGDKTKKPAKKAISKAKKVLSVLEMGYMPWPSVAMAGNGSLVFSWVSVTRDISLNIDTDGDIQFFTSQKKIDAQTYQVIDHLDSEGSITDIQAIDHIMVWYAQDNAFNC